MKRIGVALGVPILLSIALIGFEEKQTNARADSDFFWAALYVAGMEAEAYLSVEEAARAADLVVVGRIGGIRQGRVFVEKVPPGAPAEDGVTSYAEIEIDVGEELRRASKLPLGEPVRLEMMLGPGDSIETLRATLPTERAIFLLRNKGLDVASRDSPSEITEQETPYFRLVNSEGVLRELDGLAQPRPFAEKAYVLDVAGEDFKALVGAIKEAVD